MTQKPTRTAIVVGSEEELSRSAATIFQATLQKMFLKWAVSPRTLSTVTLEELDSAYRVIVVGISPEQLPIAISPERLEVWKSLDFQAESNQSLAKILGGGGVVPPPPPPAAAAKKPQATVKIAREIAGRRGKGVTVVWELPLGEDAAKELATKLKNRCGTGGTYKDGRIEIQGDHRDIVQAELEKLGYKVKRAGG